MTHVEEYLLEQQFPAKEILQKLHCILMSYAPQMEARLTYNIPFYYYFGRLCYLNPKGKGIDLGFCRGAMLSDHYLLGRKELKEVRIIHFRNYQDIREHEILPIISEAMIINELAKKGRK
ncbi:MAG: DUF1801 domain-containing protein [Prolixibacteraceae bacterium]|nr:DUF1801 domain-containing protein [Prolixibacteraceae bacterium]